MLDEYALVPDIFDPSAYSNAAYADMCLAHLKEPLLQEALVRDLCDGGWSQYCLEHTEKLHKLTKEMLRKLQTANRLCRCPACGSTTPGQASDWCLEALLGNTKQPLSGVIAAHATKQKFSEQPEVASIEKLTGTNWWQNRTPSHIVSRKTNAYLGLLDRILRHANSLMFIDPNLDPTQRNYREFHALLLPLASRNPRPRIELHRSFCQGDGRNRTFPTEPEWRLTFSGLDAELKRISISAEVFLWQDFHDRYLITDIVGVTVAAGFDVTGQPDDLTTWARLGRLDRDNIQRQYDLATRSSACKIHFRIGV